MPKTGVRNSERSETFECGALESYFKKREALMERLPQSDQRRVAQILALCNLWLRGLTPQLRLLLSFLRREQRLVLILLAHATFRIV